MLKNELIERLQSIDGNPIVLLDDTELGCIELKGVRSDKMHQSNDEENYVTDFTYKSEVGLNTFYHNNYNKKIEECVVLGII